jgi:hypothetical protein
MLTTNQDGSVVVGDQTTPTSGLTLKPEAGKAFTQAIKSGQLNLPKSNDMAQQPQPIWYGDPTKSPNEYVAVTFEDQSVLVRDGADPTGKAARYSYPEWRDLTGQGQPEQPDENRDPKGEKMAERTAAQVKQDRQTSGKK